MASGLKVKWFTQAITLNELSIATATTVTQSFLNFVR